MLDTLSSSNLTLALIAIVIFLLIREWEHKKLVAKFRKYIADERYDRDCGEMSARYWHHLLFAQLAKCYPSGLKRMQGGLRCFIQLPTGQISTWFAPNRNDPGLNDEDLAMIDFEIEQEIAELFADVPEFTGIHDGHSIRQMAIRMGARPYDTDDKRRIPEIPLRGA